MERSIMSNGTPHPCILLADDEEILLRTSEQLLTFLGYEVVTASNGHQALDTFFRNPERFALVMVDDQMPYVTGKEVCRKIHELQPGQKLLLCSGHSIEGEPVRTDYPNLTKPYTIRELKSVLEHLLETT